MNLVEQVYVKYNAKDKIKMMTFLDKSNDLFDNPRSA